MPAEEQSYHVRLSDGKEYGPAPMATLIQWAQQGRIPRDSVLVAEGGDGTKRKVSEVPELARFALAPPIAAMPLAPPAPGPISGLIPYRNAPALMGYYVSVFSLIPIIALALGPIAVVLGIIGCVKVRRRPEVRGTVHAWIAIVLGSSTFLGHVAFFMFMRR